MKTSLKIILITLVLAVMTGCSMQRRAERHIRRAVELCPELAQKKAHAIDTMISVSGYTDIVIVPVPEVLASDALSIETDNGTFTLEFHGADSTLEIGFTADPTEIHYRDTIQYSQVVVPEPQMISDMDRKGLQLLFVFILIIVLYIRLLKSENK